jgi:hypothetical protein
MPRALKDKEARQTRELLKTLLSSFSSFSPSF